MKKIIITSVMVVMTCGLALAQKIEYKILTSVESVIPMGLGRSVLLENKESANLSALTKDRTDGKKSKLGDVKRSDAKIDNFGETKLLNFYSAVGINFQNIASNDAIIQSKINELSADGWELLTVASGVESDAGDDDGTGIFITRYIFKRKVQ